jgi:glutathione S-transferase
MLEETAIDYEMERIALSSPDRVDSTEFLGASPMGKVPAIVDGEVAMSESAAICIYLADRFAPGSLAPALDAPERGQYLYQQRRKQPLSQRLGRL